LPAPPVAAAVPTARSIVATPPETERTEYHPTVKFVPEVTLSVLPTWADVKGLAALVSCVFVPPITRSVYVT
jgi:hypothetical protein